MKRSNTQRGGRGLLRTGARGAATAASLLLLWTSEHSGLGRVGAQAPDAPMTPAAATAATTAVAESQAPKTYLNKAAIQLPIHINSRVRPMLQEIRLYVKTPGTDSWQLRDKVTGNQNTFTFQAPADGEYQFTMQTVDRQGRATPADMSKEAAGLVVVVDTQMPQMELANLGASPEGTLVRFEVRDQQIDTLKTCLFYQTGDKNFRPADTVAGKTNVYCIPAQAVFTGMIRATAADLAGNTATREMNVAQLTAAAPSAAPSALPQLVGDPVAAPTTQVAQAASSGAEQPGLVTPRPATKAAPDERPMLPPPDAVVTPDPLVRPVGEVQQQTTSNKVAPTASTDGPLHKGPAFVPVEQPTPTRTPQTVPVPNSPEPKAVNETPVQTPAARSTTAVPRQVINAPKVSLEYQIEQTGPSGVGKVEVWITRDEGKSWLRLCEDSDRKSPAEVDLPGEGSYGLSLVVGNGRGFGATPPVPGDAPQMIVEVDTTRPTVEINCTRQLVDGAAVVNVTWTARDRNLAPDGVEISYSTSRQGPWLPIAKGLKGEGQHRWTPPAEVGQQAYMRLSARDQAGNTAVCETAEPVSLDDLSRPRGQILTINPAAGRATAPQGN